MKKRPTEPAVAPIPPPPPPYRDYRLILDGVNQALLTNSVDRQAREFALRHREEFECLTFAENPIAASIRALGLMGQRYWEIHGGARIGEDSFCGQAYLMMVVALRQLLSSDLMAHMDGGACDRMLLALCRNAGLGEP